MEAQKTPEQPQCGRRHQQDVLKVFIPPLKAAIKAVHKPQIDSKWAESWAAESKEKELRVLAPTPGTKILQLHKGIKKPVTALITQMRTGKIGLRAFLFARKLANNSKCECGHRFQTVRHVLLDCRKFTRLKRETWRDVQWKEPFGVVEPGRRAHEVLTGVYQMQGDILMGFRKLDRLMAACQPQGRWSA